MPNQTTPTWCEKVWALERVDPKAPEYTAVSTVRYLHALDSLYEDQHQELKRSMAKAKEIDAELRSVRLDLFIATQQRATLIHKLDSCRQELDEILQCPPKRKRARRTKKGKRTFTMPLALD
jgi:hypothetical protein